MSADDKSDQWNYINAEKFFDNLKLGKMEIKFRLTFDFISRRKTKTLEIDGTGRSTKRNIKLFHEIKKPQRSDDLRADQTR